MLISVECMPGIIFIFRADSLMLCFSSIFFIACAVHLSGNMKVFSDNNPISNRGSSFSLGPAPDVAPESKIPVLFAFRLSVFMPIMQLLRLWSCCPILWQMPFRFCVVVCWICPPVHRLDRLVGTGFTKLFDFVSITTTLLVSSVCQAVGVSDDTHPS